MHLAHTADTRADVIFIDNGAPEVLVGCHENSMAGCQGYTHCAYAKAGAATIFIHNGAPQALVGCLERLLGRKLVARLISAK